MTNIVFRQWLHRKSIGRLSVFHYHKVPISSSAGFSEEIDIAAFKKAVSWYVQWFSFLPLDEAISRMKSKSLPPRAAVMTFDDGYIDWFDGVIPVLRDNRIPATFFITSHQLYEKNPFWHERVARAVYLKNFESLPNGFDWYEGSHPTPLSYRIYQVQEKLKYLPLVEREELIQLLETGLPNNEQFRPFSAKDVIRLRDHGFHIGAHSRRHPILTTCTMEEARDEIFGCKEDLESILGDPVTQFAYPNGRPRIDFGIEHISLVKQAGFHLAVTTGGGTANQDTDIFQIPRFTPWAQSAWRNALQIIKNMNTLSKAV